MKTLLTAAILGLSFASESATLKVSGTFPEGVKVNSIVAHYYPSNPVYGCMSGESLEGTVKISGSKFDASVNYQKKIGFLCKKEIRSLSLHFTVYRMENGTNLPDSSSSYGHTINFNLDGTRTLRLRELNVFCESKKISDRSIAYGLKQKILSPECKTTAKLSVPMSGTSEVRGVNFSVAPLEAASLNPSDLVSFHDFSRDGLSLEIFRNASGVVGPLSTVRVLTAPANSLLKPGVYRVSEALYSPEGELLKISGMTKIAGISNAVEFDFSPVNTHPALKSFKVEFDELKCGDDEPSALIVRQLTEKWDRRIYCTR